MAHLIGCIIHHTVRLQHRIGAPHAGVSGAIKGLLLSSNACRWGPWGHKAAGAAQDQAHVVGGMGMQRSRGGAASGAQRSRLSAVMG